MNPREFGKTKSESDPQKTNEFLSVNAVATKKVSEREIDRVVFYGKSKACGEIQTDQESTGSSEDMELPRSVVAKVRKWPPTTNKNVNLYVHNQILRIREEDSHIGEEIAENLSTATAMDNNNNKLTSDHHHVDILVLSHKPNLPASPLSGKMAIKRVH